MYNTYSIRKSKEEEIKRKSQKFVCASVTHGSVDEDEALDFLLMGGAILDYCWRKVSLVAPTTSSQNKMNSWFLYTTISQCDKKMVWRDRNFKRQRVILIMMIQASSN